MNDEISYLSWVGVVDNNNNNNNNNNSIGFVSLCVFVCLCVFVYD